MSGLSWSAAWDAISHHGGAFIGSVLLGLLLWGLLALALSIGLYQLFARLGWLDLRGERSRAARLFFGLTLFLLVGPLLTAAGVVYSVRNAVTRSIGEELEKRSLMAPVGRVVIAPLVVSHLLVERSTGALPAALASLARGGAKPDTASLQKLWQQQTEDVSFMLDESKRQKAVAGLGDLAVDEAIAAAPIDASVADSEAGRWVVGQAKRVLVETIVAHTKQYAALFTTLRGEGGRLSYEAASAQVGLAFWQQQLRRAVESPFDQLALGLGATALGLLLVVYGLVQLIGRAVVGRRLRRQAQRAPA